jgi:tetratricopeptide (TPR) repeat protein
MKSKSFFIFLLVAIFVTGVCAPILAQKTSDKEDSKQTTQKTAKMPATDDIEIEGDKQKEKVAPVKNADYWFDKGALCATYGNDPAAIKFFQKAISLDPKRSGAYFEQGISYGQLGEFEKAIPLINRAIKMEPNNGLYIYGRARVHLLAGDQDNAMADFKKAAELDDEDAQAYLEAVDELE